MNISKKGAIIALIIGNLYGWFFLFGRNPNWFEDKQSLILVFLIVGVLLLYISVIGIVRNRSNLAFGVSGIFLSKFTSIPLVFLVNYVTATNYKNQPKKEKSKIEIVKDSSLCESIKYGAFTNGLDTIIRVREKGKEYEISLLNNTSSKCRIKWIDNCSYMVIAKSGLVTKYVQIGNFSNGNSHNVYIKPPAMGKTVEESISRYKIIKTNANNGYSK